MIIVADSKIPNAAAAFSAFGEVRLLPTKQISRSALTDADALLIRSETKITEELLIGTHVRFVGTATIGTDHVDTEFLSRHGIVFASCPGSNANSVAEYVTAALLELAHSLRLNLQGMTLGIVGHGNTGSRTTLKAAALGMNVLLNDPPLQRATGDQRYVPLDALMSADVISLHVPLTRSGPDATYHLFDEHRLEQMKPGSILINSSRGSVVDSAALKPLLLRKHFAAVVLDVWEYEPDIDLELVPLVTLGTPHIAGYSHDGKLNATFMLQEAMSRAFGIRVGPHAEAEPEHKMLHLPDNLTEQELLRAAVASAYNIGEDDLRFRQITGVPGEQRGEFFRRLRAAYPRRREFHNYVVPADSLAASTIEKLQSIGFTIR